MKEEHYFYVPEASEKDELPATEVVHATRVLRLKEDDTIHLMDGTGTFYEAQITMASNHHCHYRICASLPQQKGWQGRITLAIGPTKMMDRMEWMVEKATEIGFDQITFLRCAHSERTTMRTDRIENIVVSAMKQSRKPFKPIVGEMTSAEDFLRHHQTGRRFIAHCYPEIEREDLFQTLQATPKDEDITLLVGPEGDFSVEEVNLALQCGYESVTLGEARLRTETAGLMAVTMAQLTKRN